MNVKNLSLILLFSAVLILGCRGMRLKETNFLEAANIQTAALAIKNKIGKPFKVFKVEVKKDSFTIQLQSPDDPNNLDEYSYAAGKVSGPQPVKTASFYDFRKYVFDFDDTDFAALPAMISDSLSRSKIENAAISGLTLSRGLGGGAGDSAINPGNLFDVRWFIKIQGSRADTTAVADEHGNLLGVDVSKSADAQNYDFFDAAEAMKGIAELNKLVGDNKMIAGIHMSKKGMGFQLVDPETKKLDGYTFNENGLNRAAMSGIQSIDPLDEPFSVKELNLYDLAHLIRVTDERLPEQMLWDNDISIKKTMNGDPNHKSRIIWKVSLTRGAETAYVTYDANDKELDARKLGPDGSKYEPVR